VAPPPTPQHQTGLMPRPGSLFLTFVIVTINYYQFKNRKANF
jgi:hypothetical protein